MGYIVANGTSDKKMVPDKRKMIVASLLAAIPLATLLVATTIYRRRRRSPRKSAFLGQTRSIKSVVITTDTHSLQHKEKSQTQPQSPWQGSEINKQTATTTTTTAATIISTNEIVDEKEITTSGEVPSPMVSASISDSAALISSFQTPREEEISVSDEARKTGESLKELIVTAIKEAKDSAKETGKQLKEQTIDIATTADSKDIHSVEDNVKSLVTIFEETMIEIRKEHYNKQIKLLGSYKDLLRTHLKVIDARRRMGRKLKPGA